MGKRVSATPSPPAPEAPDAWVGATLGASILGINPRAFGRLAASGRLTVKTPPPGIPGRTLYARAELEALRKSMVKPATTA